MSAVLSEVNEIADAFVSVIERFGVNCDANVGSVTDVMGNALTAGESSAAFQLEWSMLSIQMMIIPLGLRILSLFV